MSVDPLFFFNCYVVDVSVSLGWGSEAGFCTLDIVEDPDNGYTFTAPSLGTACMFKHGALEFGGILKKWEYKESTSDGRRYQVTLESAASILTGVYVILSEFQGVIYTDDTSLEDPTKKSTMIYGKSYPTNIINIYAAKENFAYGGMFGKADLNQLGYPVQNSVTGTNIFDDITLTMSNGIFGGKIKYADSEYTLDLSELKTEILPKIPGYRISGNWVTIIDLINKVTELAVYDYTIFVTGTPDKYGVIKNPTIKIKLLNRIQPPSPNVISQTITTLKNQNPQDSRKLISYSTGKEIPDVVTQQVMLGGPASRYWLANTTYMYPIWGQIGTGKGATYFYGSIYDYGNPMAPIRITIDGGEPIGSPADYGATGSFTYVDTTMLELRCALAPNRDAWTAYHILMALRDGRDGITFGNFSITNDDFLKLLQGDLIPHDLYDTDMETASVFATYLNGYQDGQKTYAQATINARYAAIKKAAETYYGKSFLVAIPGDPGGVDNNFRWISFDQKYQNSWNPVQSAWAGDTAGEWFPDIFFYDTNGRLECLGIYPNYINADYSEIRNEYGRVPFGTNNGISVKAHIDYAWGVRWLDVSSVTGSDSAGNPIVTSATYGFVKVDLPSTVSIYDEYCSVHNGFNKLCNLIFGTDLLPGYHNLFGFENLDFAMPESRVAPEYIGIPQESTKYVWGPWYSFNKDSGQKGKVNIVDNKQMNPETYGSIGLMNEAAKIMINAELASVAFHETGYVELAEIPQYNLADRFFGSGPYVTQLSISISANGGSKTTYNFQNWTKRYGQLAKYNIEAFAQARSNAFNFSKDLRDLFRMPAGRPIPRGLLGTLEKRLQDISKTSANGFYAVQSHAIANAINGTDRAVGTNVQASPHSIAARSLGSNYMESFGASFEQIYTPVFTYDQTDPARVRRLFNQGNL